MGDKVKTAEEEISEHIEGPVVFTENTNLTRRWQMFVARKKVESWMK